MEIGSGREDCMSMGMTSEVLTAVKIQIEVFWVLTPCSVGEPCCLHLQGED